MMDGRMRYLDSFGSTVYEKYVLITYRVSISLSNEIGDILTDDSDALSWAVATFDKGKLIQ